MPSFKLPRHSFLLVTALIAFVSLISPTVAGGNGDIYVKSGGSIQAAIQGAKSGSRIIVQAGTYAEQITIDKDNICLVGKGAIIVPPASPTENLCTGLAGNDTQAGICVAGTGVKLDPYVQEHQKVQSVDKPVKGASISGFEVRGFSGSNIAVVGAQDTLISNNKLYDGAAYGFLAAGSKNTRVMGNLVNATSALLFVALCTDDMSPAKVIGNRLSGYAIGLCIQTAQSDLEFNDISNVCVGAFMDPGVTGAKVRFNHIGAPNPKCVTDWPFTTGIIADGAKNAQIQFNLVENQKRGGMAAGIAVVDEFTVDPPAIASGNVVAKNIFRNNDFDIFVNTTGSGNVVQNNKCTTPAELCTGN